MLLALQTACEPGGIALAHAGELLAEQLFDAREQSGAVLVPAIQSLLRERGLRLADLDAIALAVGPGSFTGLRVGLATALGLSFPHPLPLVPVGTLAALSLGARAEGSTQIAALLDARRGELYAGLYGPDAQPLLPDRVCTPAAFLDELAARPGSFALLGSGAPLCAELAAEQLGARARLCPPLAGPRPAWIAELGERALKQGEALPPEQLRLRYLRRPEAEEQRAARERTEQSGSC